METLLARQVKIIADHLDIASKQKSTLDPSKKHIKVDFKKRSFEHQASKNSSSPAFDINNSSH